jgi:hypothetical protein
VGFDPTHIQPVGITIAQAKADNRANPNYVEVGEKIRVA